MLFNFEENVGFCVIKKKEDLKNAKTSILAPKVKDKLVISLDCENYDSDTLKEVYSLANIAKEQGYETQVCIEIANLQFKGSETKHFVDMEEECGKKDIGFSFSEGSTQYSLNETMRAQSRIDEIVATINKSGASPFEKYLMAYNFVTTKIYKENGDDKGSSRNLVSVINGDDIVCVGFARLMKRICDGIGIKSYCQGCFVENKNSTGEGHLNNLVYMKDEKYGIDGWYYSDACWDSKVAGKNNLKLLNRCLIPLSDVDKMQDCKITIENDEKIDGMPIHCIYGDFDVSSLEGKDWCDVKENLKSEDASEIESDAESKFLSDKRRSAVCDALAKIFKQEKIPADIYSSLNINTNSIPKECRLDYMLSLLMQDNPNAQEISKCISELKKLASKSETSSENNSSKSNLPNDVYEELNNLSSKTSKKMKSLARLKSGELVDIFSMDVDVEFDQIEEFDAVKEEYSETPSEWNKAMDYYKTSLGVKTLDGYSSSVKRGQTISLNTFKTGLKNNFISKGLDEYKADEFSNRIISTNVNLSKRVFSAGANNAFFQASLENLNEQNLE